MTPPSAVAPNLISVAILLLLPSSKSASIAGSSSGSNSGSIRSTGFFNSRTGTTQIQVAWASTSWNEAIDAGRRRSVAALPWHWSSRVLRGGGRGSRQSGRELPRENGGESNDVGTCTSDGRARQEILDPAQLGSCFRGGVDAEVVAINGQGGQKTVMGAGKDVASRPGGSITMTPPSVPAALAAAHQPSVVDAQEDALRAALLQAQGPRKILREVERIPALRRLSDSALRVTSASDADGRLAALALYRLGSAARAAENAFYAPAVASTSASVSDPVFGTTTAGSPSVAAGAAARSDERTADGGMIPTYDGDERGGAQVEKGIEGIVGKTAEEREGDDDDAARRGRLEVPHIVSSEKRSASPGNGRGLGYSAGFPMATAALMPQDEGTVDTATPLSETEDTVLGIRDGGVGIKGEAGVVNEGKDQGHADDGASEAEAAVASAAAASAAFDVGEITSDLRFEQLVEIVECTASRMTVSDVSKAVWGLSILGHVPRNSLLETLAGLVTDKIREECGQSTVLVSAGTDTPAAVQDPSALRPSSNVESLSDTESAATATGPEVGDFEQQPQNNGGAGGAAQSSAVEGVGSEARMKTGSGKAPNTGGMSLADNDGGGGGAGAADGHGKDDTSATSGAIEGADVGTVPKVPSVWGTDLATAALCFACAHVRLDISIGELLEVIAACAKPVLPSMNLRDLANLAWSFAAQRRLDEELMLGIAREITASRSARRMTVKDVSLFAWSYGMLGLRLGRVVRTLIREGYAMLGDATPHDLSNMAWGLARAGVDGRDLHMADDLAAVSKASTAEGEDVAASVKGGDSADVSSLLSDDEEDDGDDDAVDDSDSGVLPRSWGWTRRRGKQSKRWIVRRRATDDGVDISELGEGRSAKAPKDNKKHEFKVEGLVDMAEASSQAASLQGSILQEEDKEEEEEKESEGEKEEEDRALEQKLGEALLAKAVENFRMFQPKQLSRLCWALGAWHEQGVVLSGAAPFTARALAEAGQHTRYYTAEELAQILWAFATLAGKADSPGHELAGLVGALAAGFELEGPEDFVYAHGGIGGGVRSGAGRLDAATACDVLWSLATLGHPAHGLCEAIGRALVDKVQELPPSSVASLVWAHAKMGHPSCELMERVQSVVERRLDEFTVEDAASALWALGVLGFTVSLKKQFHVKMEELRSLNPSAVANLMWGLVKTEAAFADGFERECLQALAADIGPKLLSFSPRELCRTAWALGRLGSSGVGVTVAAAVGDGDESQEDGLASAEGGSGGELSGLLDKVLGECSKWLELFSPQELETVLWAVCRVEHRADDLVAAMAVEVTSRQERLSALSQQSGASAGRDAAFHLGACRHLLTAYRDIDFDGQRAEGRYRRGKSMLSRMFRER